MTMGPIGSLLALPVTGPVGALQWLARQIAEQALQQMLDPVRIETALRDLETRLEAGEIEEHAFEAEEDRLLAELAEMRAIRAQNAASPDEAA
jgi:hypothetical protein